jgi:hypothetical protein
MSSVRPKFSYLSLLTNRRGQVALFVALIFQVLFVFFAMIVNVGLLVHHKINLQNSVDLAAYYGASKQAEMLNAIAHVNYQIRQSYKLLTFRYGVLGTAGASAAMVGVTDGTPYIPASGAMPAVMDDSQDVPFTKAPSFCTTYSPFEDHGGVSYCKDAVALVVPKPVAPSLTSDPFNFFSFQASIAAAINAANANISKICENAVAQNWLNLVKYIAIYKTDVANRKKFLLALANQMSSGNPLDIDGESVRMGVYKTLIKNLSYPNRESISSKYGAEGVGSENNEAGFSFLNSLSLDSCNAVGPDAPPKWLSEVFILPLYYYIDGICGANNSVTFEATQLDRSVVPANASSVFGAANVRQLLDFASEPATASPTALLYRSSLGFEKNPWCVAYVGVSAKATPKIPFSPLGSVTLRAVAYAKPFGGRIGPWYGSTWSPGQTQSNGAWGGADLSDKLLPPRVSASNAVGVITPSIVSGGIQRLVPNFSRYSGDQAGVYSKMTAAQFEKVIHTNGMISNKWYDHFYGVEDINANKSGNGDPLAWNDQLRTAPFLRNLEIAAIAPDQFDSTYYSIDPDFYNNYLLRIQKGYDSKFQFMLRGDLGSRAMGDANEKKFSIRSQIETVTTTQKTVEVNKLSYMLNSFGQLLTSWQQVSPDSYALDTSRFGKCLTEVRSDEALENFTPGSCKAGGRTGYSVKLVDGKFLKNEVNGSARDYELGGPGVTGKILNPPPDRF